VRTRPVAALVLCFKGVLGEFCVFNGHFRQYFQNLPRGTKKKETNAHVHLQNPSKKHPPTSFFFLFPRPIFLLHFQALLSKWSSKTPKTFLWMSKKVDVYKKMRKIPFRFFLGEREPLNGLILIEATYRNGIHGSH
jgi:hypothetical protein